MRVLIRRAIGNSYVLRIKSNLDPTSKITSKCAETLTRDSLSRDKFFGLRVYRTVSSLDCNPRVHAFGELRRSLWAWDDDVRNVFYLQGLYEKEFLIILYYYYSFFIILYHYCRV